MRRRLNNSRMIDPFDEWLEAQGLYRKQVARDGSCLFRAVAEQVFMTQTRHVVVRSICLEYMMLHKEDFQPFLEEPVDHHVFKMQDVREWGGHPEILAMSRCFKVDFLIYQEIGRPPVKATENGFMKLLMLSFTHGNHYDIIYKKEETMIRGFCQSILYDILYSRVFKLKEVGLAVDTMLHDKEYASLRRDSSNSAENKEIVALVDKVLGTSISRENSQDEADKNTTVDEKSSLDDIHPDDVRGLLNHGIPPFPYKVAKSLDPDLYRNIEFDAWNTERREARYGPFDSNGFQAGVKVLIKLELLPDRKEIEKMRKAHTARQGKRVREGRTARQANADSQDAKQEEERVDVYHGHIQEMSENRGPVDVFIEEIGMRLKVPYESLEKVPPTPPRSPWHQQGRGTPGGGGAVGASVAPSVPSYKKLTGYYQKAPLPMESEYPTGRSKKKGKQTREVVTIFQSSSVRFRGHAGGGGGLRGRTTGSPSPHTNSPRARTPQGPPHHHNLYSSKVYTHRGTNYRNSQSPAHDGYHSYPPGANQDTSVDGMWAVRASACQGNLPNSQMACTPRPICPSLPPPPQVIEVISVEKQDTQYGSEVDKTPTKFNDTSTPKAEEKVNGTGVSESFDEPQGDERDPLLSPTREDNSLQVEPLNQTPSMTASNGDVLQSTPVFQPDHSIAYVTPPPPIPAQQLACTPSPHGPMFTVTCPPSYPSPGLLQVVSPMSQPDGQGTPSEFSPPSSTTSTVPHQSECWDPNSQDPEALKMSQAMPPYMVYQVPMMYGGEYGNFGYNQQWGYPVPLMQSPTMEANKPLPSSGSEGYPQMVTISGWNPGYTGEVMPQPLPGPPVPPPPPPPPPLPHGYPPLLRDPAPLPYPFPQQERRGGSRERPFYPHNPRGRGRGGHHNFGQHRGNQHNNNFQGVGPGVRGGALGPPRPLPPRFQRGGGPGNRGGGNRHQQYQNNGPPHHYPHPNAFHPNAPLHHQYRPTTHQYEGQPLMHMGSRKSSSDSLTSQVASGGSVGSSGLASPPLVTYMEPERGPPHAMLPMPPPDATTMPQQDVVPMPVPPGYYTAPPGYVVTGPWMWKMM